MVGLFGIKQNQDARCRDAFSPLSDLDRSYDYGFCSLALVPDDDLQLADRIDKAVERAGSCTPNEADGARLSFYRLVRDDLRGTKREGRAVCAAPERAGPEEVWLRLHCLQRQFASPSWLATDGPAWAKLAGQFGAQESASQPGATRDRLGDCAAIARAQAYHSLAAITGEPEATEHLMAVVDTIRGSEEVAVVKLAADSLATYGQKPPPPGSWYGQADLVRARDSLKILEGNEPDFLQHHVTLWHQLLPRLHGPLWFAAMGVVVERFAALRSKDAGFEGDFVALVRRLETDLRQDKQPELAAAADFLLAERELIKQGWYQQKVTGAADDCVNGPAARRRTGATTLEQIRSIYGWWPQADLTREQWKQLQDEAPWLNWWGAREEITTALCALATGRIKPEEGRLRLERLLKELPTEATLCPYVGGELWAAATHDVPWLTAKAAEEKCPPS